MMNPLGGVVLCGGQSRRMGRPKEWLPIGDEALLQRVVRIILCRASPVIVSAAPNQLLPDLPRSVEVTRDLQAGLGPLQGIATGLAAISGRTEWVFVTATDCPLLQPSWIDRLLELSAGVDLVLPRVDGFDQPLSALYRPETVLPAVTRLLSQGVGRLSLIREEVRTRVVTMEELVDVDPSFLTLKNINHREDYEELIRQERYLSSKPGAEQRFATSEEQAKDCRNEE